ncbi:MAG TPA: DMT family transporter, partial [Fusibacter sp.]|nr:DMT family transporter [Fusibacter sp.]
IVFLWLTASMGEVKMLPDVPVHYFIGGLLGLSVILLMNYYSVRIKALHVAILPFLGQMTMGLALDYFLFDKLNVKTVIGLVIVLLGLYIQSEQKKKVVEF